MSVKKKFQICLYLFLIRLDLSLTWFNWSLTWIVPSSLLWPHHHPWSWNRPPHNVLDASLCASTILCLIKLLFIFTGKTFQTSFTCSLIEHVSDSTHTIQALYMEGLITRYNLSVFCFFIFKCALNRTRNYTQSYLSSSLGSQSFKFLMAPSSSPDLVNIMKCCHLLVPLPRGKL